MQSGSSDPWSTGNQNMASTYRQVGGIPSHLDDNQKIIVRERGGGSAKKPTLEKIEKGDVSMFTEKLAATIGPSYVASFFLGGFIGMTKAPPLRNRRSKKLMINAYINNVGKTSARFGNNVGGAIFMYIMMGKFMNFLFLEEFEEIPFFTVPV